jgi:hypothetical protein
VTTVTQRRKDDYPEQNARATYAKAKFARIQPIIHRQTVHMEIEPRPIPNRRLNNTYIALV